MTESAAIDVSMIVDNKTLSIDDIPSHYHTGGVQWADTNDSLNEYGITKATNGHMIANFVSIIDYGASRSYDLYDTSSVGGGKGHNHNANAKVSSHNHAVTISIPYYIIIFIMKK